MAEYPDHDWRIERHGMIRSGVAASISMGWCDSGDASWRWYVFEQQDCSQSAGGECKTHLLGNGARMGCA